MSTIKILTAAIAAATFGLAFAQGTPPRPATDPAVGAGQRSTQNTPMGDTGTPGGGGTARGTSASGAGAADTAPASAGSSASTTTAGGGTAMASDTHTTHKAKHHKKHKKVKKVDRT
jgi:hypothetical protein